MKTKFAFPALFALSLSSFTATAQTERLVEISREHGKEILEEHVPDILSHLKEFYDEGFGGKDLGEILAHAVIALQEKARPNEQHIPEELIILFNAYAANEQIAMTFDRLYSLRSINFLFAIFSSQAAYAHLSELLSSEMLREWYEALFGISL